MTRTQVLIAGAGPTGLVLALWLTRQGVSVRIVDKAAEPGTTSRAVAVQARTLELYRQMGLDEAVVRDGQRVEAAHLWVKGEERARIPLADIGKGLSPYAYLVMYPQDRHEAMLIAHLQAAGVEVERPVELLGFKETAKGVAAQLKLADGREETCEADYLAGCDGAHSVVRHALNVSFPGGDYEQLFYVADVEADGPPMDGDLHVDLDSADFLAIFPLAEGRARFIGTVRGERAEHPEALSFDDVSRDALESLKIQVRTVRWFSTYRVHHRVASAFRQGRALLAGDAGHIHSPAGGQGMNTGIGDAINLAWKLAAVVQGRAPAALLDSYNDERLGFARQLVKTTDQVFTGATATGETARMIRTEAFPRIAPPLLRLPSLRRFAFRTVSQIGVRYADSSLSVGKAGRVAGGMRPPLVSWAGGDNLADFDGVHWRVQVYGDPSDGLSRHCGAMGLKLQVIDWSEAARRAGFHRDALYLLRPDGYVALADAHGDPDSIDRYLAERQIAI
jgi:2-polyprenyl-6-methoxyphenol hydroxylase-like FAD-dependent oxidoreductase